MSLNLTGTITALSILAVSQTQPILISEHTLATHEMSLEQRYTDSWVNNIFKENILLTLAYLKGDKSDLLKTNWNYEFKLEPNQTFAFHDDVLDQYKGKVVKTTNAHFNRDEGFKSDGYLFGDGVCHLASLLYWVAKDAALSAKAPTNHDFVNIPQIPKEMSVSILNIPGAIGSNQRQNLYITNNRPKIIAFKFEYANSNLKVSVIEVN